MSERVGDKTVSLVYVLLFFCSSRRRHTRLRRDWSSDVCSSDLVLAVAFTVIDVAAAKFKAAIVCAEVDVTVAVVAVASTTVSDVFAPKLTVKARVAAAAVIVVVAAVVLPVSVNEVKALEVTVLVAPPLRLTVVNVLPNTPPDSPVATFRA